MIGRYVFEVCFFLVFLAFWIACYWLPQGLSFREALPTVASSAHCVVVAAIASIVGAVAFSIFRDETHITEVFGVWEVMIFGGLVSAFCYAAPFALYGGYIPGGDGLTMRVIKAGAESDLVLSFLVSLAFSLGGSALYLAGQGLKSFILKKH